MEVLGDPVDDKKVILKYLRVVPKEFKQRNSRGASRSARKTRTTTSRMA
jgi:hypothetical protein